MKVKFELDAKKYHLSISKQFIHDDIFEDDGLIVFVRGNGFWINPAKWLNAKEIATLHQKQQLSLDEIDGTFVIVIHDKKSHELKLISDHLNFFPFYFDLSESIIRISDSLASFKSHKLDESGITEMVSMGSVLGEKTIFRGVSKFPAASISLINYAGDLAFNQYWKCTSIPTSEEEFKTIFSETLKVIPKLSSAPSLTLTAGLDSRMVLSQLVKDRININTFTFGDPKSADMKIAATIAKKLDLNHIGYEMHVKNTDFTRSLDSIFSENQKYTDGMINSLKALHTNYCISKVAEKNDMIITATGELVYSHYAEVPTIRKKDSTSIEAISDFLVDFNIERNLLPDENLKEIKDNLKSILSKYVFQNNQHYYDAFYLEKLSSLTSYLQQMISSKVRVFNPIFTKKMIVHSLGLPNKSRKKRNFQRRLIVENNSTLNTFLVNGFKVVRPTLKTYVTAKISYAIRLLKKAINRVAKSELFLISYIQYSKLIHKNRALVELIDEDLNEDLLRYFQKNKLKKINFNLKILNHWLSRSHEETGR